MNNIEQRPVLFSVEGVNVRGVLYLPGAGGPLPCVVMANGFSGTMDWILPSFAEKFSSAGIAVLLFDYRHLGESDGEPRQLVDIDKQRADLRAAIELARSQPNIDPERIALWGTSLGGSHVVEVASEDPRIAAVVLNMPALDAISGANLEAKREKANASKATVVWTTMRLLTVAVRDAVRGALGLSPKYLEVYGAPGKAFFTDPDLAERFALVAAKSPTWQNRVAARFMLKVPRYREGSMERITGPILVCLAEHDIEVSARFIQEKTAKAKRSEVRIYPAGHFDLYHGEAFEQVASDQTKFLRANLA